MATRKFSTLGAVEASTERAWIENTSSDASAAAAAASASASAAPPPTKPRKRGKAVHNRQVLDDFLIGNDMGADEQAPTELLAGVGVDELYDDYSKYVNDDDVSLKKIPRKEREKMLAALQRTANKRASRRMLRANDKDPTAITVPQNHAHRLMPIPDHVHASLAAGQPLVAVDENHHAELCRMTAYESVENWVVDQQMNDTLFTVRAKDVVQAVRPCMPHGVERMPDGGLYIVFDVERRGVFYVTVKLNVPSQMELNKGYTAWDSTVVKALESAAGHFMGYAYFECMCDLRGPQAAQESDSDSEEEEGGSGGKAEAKS